MPDYAKSSYYNEYTPHSGGRRATYTQSPEEEALEKQLIQLFLKHSDQNFLTGDQMLWAHNLNYKAHAQQAWSGAGLDYPDFVKQTIPRHKHKGSVDASCHGFIKGSQSLYGTGQYGFFNLRVLYASKTDLASQTTRTARWGKARYTGVL